MKLIKVIIQIIIKYVANQKTNSIISLFGGNTKEEQLKRYLFSDLQVVIINKLFQL